MCEDFLQPINVPMPVDAFQVAFSQCQYYGLLDGNIEDIRIDSENIAAKDIIVRDIFEKHEEGIRDIYERIIAANGACGQREIIIVMSYALNEWIEENDIFPDSKIFAGERDLRLIGIDVCLGGESKMLFLTVCLLEYGDVNWKEE